MGKFQNNTDGLLSALQYLKENSNLSELLVDGELPSKSKIIKAANQLHASKIKMKLNVDSDYSALTSNTRRTGFVWKHYESAEYLKVTETFDNGRTSGELIKISDAMIENGNVRIYYGNSDSVKYDSWKAEALRLDTIGIIVKTVDDDERGELMLKLGILNGRAIYFIELSRGTNNNAFERFYFNGDVPGGYQSLCISAPSWNLNRNFELLKLLRPYFEDVNNFIDDNDRYNGRNECSVMQAFKFLIEQKK